MAGERGAGTRHLAPGSRSKGSVLILAMILVAVLALIATAFIISARLEARAATNALRGVQAEAACRAGLAHAVARVQAVYDLGGAISLYHAGGDSDAWREAFYDASGPDLCPDEWVRHYDSSETNSGMTAKKFPMPRGGSASAQFEQIKRARGFVAEYYVAVADLDGKLRVNPKNWDTLISSDDDKLRNMLLCFIADGSRAETIRDYTTPIWSPGSMRRVYALPDAAAMTEAESFMTVYPRKLSDLDPPTDRPPVNVNTARENVLRAILYNVPGLGDAQLTAVVGKLTGGRPFADRNAMEAAIDDLAPAPVGDATLTEEQFNDVLNSLNFKGPSVYANDGNKATSTEGVSGVYEYDFDPPPAGSPPAQTGGDKTSDQASATWGTEVKFTSRYFHFYVMGRTLDPTRSPPEPRATRRLHAIYDARIRRVLWSRWNFYAKANMTD
ncbi:MAG: hypothetical protein ACYTGB_11580 [Planctomycetota bacterium]|jgi:hypothetical protein